MSELSDLEVLLLILAGFYLFECAIWVRSGAVLLVAQLPGRTARIRQTALLQNDQGSLLFGNLLPLGHATPAQPWPLSLSPGGVYAFVIHSLLPQGRPPGGERFLRYQDIRQVETNGRELLLNGAPFVKTSSTELARHLAELLRRLLKLPVEKRADAIEQALADSFSAADVARHFQRFQRLTIPCSIACLTLFVYLFALLPPLARREQSLSPAQGLLILVGLMALIALLFQRCHRRLFPAQKKTPWRSLALMLVSPADAIHARDTLFRELLSAYHPLALAAVLSSHAQLLEFAGRVIRDQHYPQPYPAADQSNAARETAVWFHECLGRTFQRFLRRHGIEERELLRAPLPENETCLAYCPRCLGQYERSEGMCHGCLRPLRVFAAASAALTS